MNLLKADEGKRGTKGIIFAADSGANLHPTTQVVPKGLIPIYDKPMIYYPLSTLLLAGIRDILIVCLSRDLQHMMELLGNGSRLGVNLSYAEHPRSAKSGKTFLTAKRFIGPAPGGVCLILADTVLHGVSDSLHDALKCGEGATLFASQARGSNGRGDRGSGGGRNSNELIRRFMLRTNRGKC